MCPDQQAAPADAADVVALLFAGFLREADASQRLGLGTGELKSLLDDLGLGGAAMVPVEVDDELNTYYADLGRSAFDAPTFDDVIDNFRGSAMSRATVRLRLP